MFSQETTTFRLPLFPSPKVANDQTPNDVKGNKTGPPLLNAFKSCNFLCAQLLFLKSRSFAICSDRG